MSEKKKRTYQSETLALPPLAMVLVHSKNDRANAAAGPSSSAGRRKTKRQAETEEVVLRIIEHLEKNG